VDHSYEIAIDPATDFGEEQQTPPRHVLLFHDGSYVGPATPDRYSYVSLDPALTTDDTVVLKYGKPGSCSACPDMTFTIVQFKWQVDHVAMIGSPPGT
jgi:serine/threonine-protein kinase